MSQPEEDFATLFEASLKKSSRHQKGQQVEGTIVAIGPEVAFVDIGGKGEAEIDLAELKDSEGRLEAAVGDRIQATVMSTAGTVTLSRRLIRGAATLRGIGDAFDAGIAVEGKVDRVVKGGYEVRIAGERAFCPLSQIDTVRTADPNVHVGRVYAFRVIEFKDGGKNLVVSRRALLEEEQQAKAAAAREAVVPGAILTGRVASVRDFGAFVDLGGGVQGLLHVSELGWSRVTSAENVLSVGEEVTVKVLRVDEATQKISLGMRQLTEDPWSKVGAVYAVGQVRQGTVTRIAQFGAFVELEPGIEALAHASTFPPTGRKDDWAAQVPVGTVAPFEILAIDLEQKRMGVALVEEGSTREAAAAGAASIAPGARLTGKVERHERFGVFVFLAPGRTALMPLVETGVAREADVVKTFPVGSSVDVIVLDVDETQRRIRVSRKAVLDRQEADELREYHERAGAARDDGFGTLGARLRDVFGKRDR